MKRRIAAQQLVAVLMVASLAVGQQQASGQGAPSARDIVDAAVAAGRVDAQVALDIRSGGSGVALIYVNDIPTPAAPVTSDSDAGPTAGRPEVADGAAGLGPDPRALEQASTRRILLDNRKDVALSSLRSRVQVTRRYADLPVSKVTISSEAALAAVLSSGAARFVGADVLVQRSITQSLGLIRQGSAPAGTTGGLGTFVAVLDSGADYTRAALGSCTAPGVPITCRVADMPPDFAPSDGVLDDDLHGTAVSAIAAATAPGTKLIVGDVFSGSSASASDILAGINYVISRRLAGVNVVALNLSLGIPNTYSCSIDRFSLGALEARGIQPVVASGNSASPNGVYRDGISDPACSAPSVLSVGGVYDQTQGFSVTWSSGCSEQPVADKVLCISQASPGLSMLAPGALIDVAGLADIGGTSFAAPFVAGAVAFAASLRPDMSPAQIRTALALSGHPVTDARNGRTTPRLDLTALDQRLRPLNDLRSQPTDVALAGASAITFDNRLALSQAGDPSTTGSGRTLWYRLTAASGSVRVDVPAGAVVRAFRQGLPISVLADGAGQQSIGPLDVTSSTPVELVVDRLPGASAVGSLALVFDPGATAAANDDRTAATIVGAGVSTVVTAFATSAAGDAHRGSGPGHSVWFSWTPAPGQTVGISTRGTNFDASLVVFGGGPTPLCDTTSVPGLAAQCVLTSPGPLLIGVDGVDAQHGTAYLHTLVLAPIARTDATAAEPPAAPGPRSAAAPAGTGASAPGRSPAPPVDIVR